VTTDPFFESWVVEDVIDAPHLHVDGAEAQGETDANEPKPQLQVVCVCVHTCMQMYVTASK